jgi:hypothetical protein
LGRKCWRNRALGKMKSWCALLLTDGERRLQVTRQQWPEANQFTAKFVSNMPPGLYLSNDVGGLS